MLRQLSRTLSHPVLKKGKVDILQRIAYLGARGTLQIRQRQFGLLQADPGSVWDLSSGMEELRPTARLIWRVAVPVVLSLVRSSRAYRSSWLRMPLSHAVVN
ncbi:hypothetical protein [Ralstonia pseudosolanacearum]|uniref:hypothetical protein n=1 Tax=Ralstonia pseudosolanacearum TaxID=1310165 RepID=UPI00386F8555